MIDFEVRERIPNPGFYHFCVWQCMQVDVNLFISLQNAESPEVLIQPCGKAEVFIYIYFFNAHKKVLKIGVVYLFCLFPAWALA